MEHEREELRSRMHDLEDRLRSAGLKATYQRLEVFREVAGSREHPDAEAVYKAVRERVPTMSLDTVYRTLWLLIDVGLITALATPHERVRFDGNGAPHHHFVCTKCGAMHDLYSEEWNQLRMPDSVHSFGSVERAHVEVRGICLHCLDGANQTGPTRSKKEER